MIEFETVFHGFRPPSATTLGNLLTNRSADDGSEGAILGFSPSFQLPMIELTNPTSGEKFSGRHLSIQFHLRTVS
jgi:hypothetical protein